MTQQLPLPLVAGDEQAPATEAPMSREQRRSRRHRATRARTISTKRLTKRELELGRMLYPVDERQDIERPKTRADCASVPRPCPFVSCVHHNYLDVSAKTGAIKLNFPDLDPWDLPPSESCALDVAEKGGETLEIVGRITNLTRERIRQIEVKGLAKMEAAADMAKLREFYGDVDGGKGKRRLPVLPTSVDEHEEQDDEGSDDDDAEAGEDFDVEDFVSAELDDVR